jgi:hypothetical protein
LYAVWSVVQTAAAADRLRQDVGELVTLQAQLDDIQRFSEAPAVAALEVESPDQIVNRIDAAVRSAGLNESVLANQTPSQPQRIAGSDFTLRRVEIQLNAAAVPQIVAFCEALKDESTGSLVRDLQLYEPRRVGGRETWKSQLTLTQVIFSPKSDS